VRSAQVGGHQTYMKTLDSRTLGIAGGSLVQVKDKAIVEVGPRSAHIAGLPYTSFTAPEALEKLEVSTVQPLAGDPSYLVVRNEKGEAFAVTTTCAANFLKFVREGDYAWGNDASTSLVFEALGAYFALKPEEVARKILDKAVEKIVPTLDKLKEEYELKDRQVRLIGGGGGSYAIVPYLAHSIKNEYEIASHAEIISAIGAALAMVRETVEKNIFNPRPEDIEAIRQEAEKSVLRMGASPESIEVHIEVDGQKNIVRAIATGSMEFRSQDLLLTDIGEEERIKLLAGSFSIPAEGAIRRDSTDYLHVYEVEKTEKRLWNLLKSTKHTIVVMDGKGTMKLQVPEGKLYGMVKDEASGKLKKIIDENRVYGDAGSAIPAVFILLGQRVLDLSSVLEEEQVLSLARTELERAGKADRIIAIAKRA